MQTPLRWAAPLGGPKKGAGYKTMCPERVGRCCGERFLQTNAGPGPVYQRAPGDTRCRSKTACTQVTPWLSSPCWDGPKAATQPAPWPELGTGEINLGSNQVWPER